MDTASDATGRDTPRLAATGRDIDYVLSLDDVAARYAAAGHPRTLRTLQRYCASGHLDSQKMATPTGDKYLVTPQSVDRHLAQIEELLQGLGVVATGRDTPRQVATSVEQADKASRDGPAGAMEGDDGAGQTRAGETTSSLLVAQLEKRIEEKDEFISLLTTQLTAKDQQFTDLSARYRETHSLLGAMQRMLAPALGQADPYNAPPDQRGATDVASGDDASSERPPQAR